MAVRFRFQQQERFGARGWWHKSVGCIGGRAGGSPVRLPAVGLADLSTSPFHTLALGTQGGRSEAVGWKSTVLIQCSGSQGDSGV